MTCKDCIYFSLCEYNTNIAGDSKIKLFYDTGAEKCSFFKNKADFVEVDKISPCDVCAYNPPSSLDGKPCALCPATKKRGEIHNG